MISRIVSALIAVGVLVGVKLGLGRQGLVIFAALGCSLGMIEYSKLKLPAKSSYTILRLSFFVLAALVFSTSVFRPDLGLLALAICSVTFFTLGVVSHQKGDSLQHTQQQLMSGVLGLVYCGAMPAFAVSLLYLPNGQAWFAGLLAIVFAGDTAAYFAGRFFGKRKLHEAISPKKTIEGSLGSLVGAAIAGFVMAKFFIPEVPVIAMIAVALVSNLFAQVGDLFESLLKRVSDVKDSGGIMPGHGGALDRLDGVYFAAPIYLALAVFLKS